MIIGLSGYARTGKDEVAKILVERHGFKRVAFADKLREVLYALNPIVKQTRHLNTKTLDWFTTTVDVQDVINNYGWDGYKETQYGPEIRRLLQRLGTEAGRQALWDSIWIDAALTGIKTNDRVVLTDCRFENEAIAVVEEEGFIVRVERPGVGPTVGNDGLVHPSETSLDDWDFDFIINNDGTLKDLANKVDALMERI